MKDLSLNTTDILAAASRCLETHGYSLPNQKFNVGSVSAQHRMFEDEYGVVALVVYDTWEDLLSGWVNAQSSLVEIISQRMTTSDMKSWEGYLVLMTPNFPSGDGDREATRIRYDVSRLRKIVATGADISTVSDVETALLPLLPLQIESTTGTTESVLDLLPTLLEAKGIPEDQTHTVINAFIGQEPILERLHQYRSQNET